MPFYYTIASSLSVRTLVLLAAQPDGRLPTAGATRAAPIGIPQRSQTRQLAHNMVEIEIGVLRSQCLDRRIPSQERLVSEIAASERIA